MIENWAIILIHQFVFQGMFVTKNILLRRQTGKQIRGKNKEANVSIIFFITFIGIAFGISALNLPFSTVHLLSSATAIILASILLLVNVIIALLSLLHLKESWRVGVIEGQKTELITTGIYKFTRNPYFVSYLLMFAAYTILLQNLVLLSLSFVGFFLIHKMITKEEEYLYASHGSDYSNYKKKIPRYIIV